MNMTKSERQAASIAKKLVAALLAIENFHDDIAMVFEEPVTIVKPGAAEAWLVLKKHYIRSKE